MDDGGPRYRSRPNAIDERALLRKSRLMPATPVSLIRRGAAAVITLDRPDRMNALSKEALVTLGEYAREARRDPAVRAIVLTGAGEKAFCAGADLKERQGMTD